VTDPSKFEVLGTGFVFGPSRQMVTCAHVIDELDTVTKKRGPKPTFASAQFVRPAEGRPALETLFRAARVVERAEETDIAILEVVDLPPGIIAAPIVGPDYNPEVGEEIGVCGYAHGSAIMRRGKEITRFGPILQRGIVSAVVPYESLTPAIIILDVIAGPAASGSPVFRMETGEVCGIVFEGQINRSAALSAARVVQFGGERGLTARWARPRLDST
jgi:S1-C subfamily serine protease